MSAGKAPRLAVVVCLTGLYLLVGSREPPWGDARIMHEVALSLVARQTVAVETEWPPMSHRGDDGRVYAQYALGPSLVQVPGVWVRNAILFATARKSPSRSLAHAVTSHLASAVLAALTCVMFMGWCRRLGASARAATVGTWTLAVATMLAVYARSPFSEALQTACVFGFVTAVVAAAEAPTRRHALIVGAWAGALVNAKAVLALSAIGGAVFLAFELRRDRAALARVAGWAAVAAVPGALAFAIYNQLRWGSPLDTGYSATLDQLGEHPLTALLGYVASPGKSLFLYSPPLVIGAIALVRFARTHGRAARAMAWIALPLVAFYCRFLAWGGDYCWGPRYLLPLVPLLMVPAVVSAWPTIARSRVAAGAAAGVVVIGLGVQVLGAAYYWDTWIRIAIKVRDGWLGQPARDHARLPINEWGLCDACVEDTHGHTWIPSLSPLAGHAWLLRHHGDPLPEALADAPWRRYNRAEIPGLEAEYATARLDWWVLSWADQNPGAAPLGVAFLVVFMAMTAGGGIVWWRRVRAGGSAPRDPGA